MRSSAAADGDDLAMNLRPYQIESIQSVFAAYERDVTRQLLVLPTGTGKTVTFSALVDQFISQQKRALVLAHRDRLIQQAAEKISKQIPWQSIGIVLRIHWQALQLWLKRVPYFTKPDPPFEETTR